MIKPLMLVPPLVFAGLAAMFLVGMYRDDPDSLPSTLVGREAPTVALGQLGDLSVFDDADLRQDGVKLVNFWASWCAPCRAEHPMLTELAQEGITILGVNYKDDPAKAQAFLNELGDPYTAIGTDQGRMALDWGVYGVPETYVIDANGKVVLRLAGPISRGELERSIRPALAEAEAANK